MALVQRSITTGGTPGTANQLVPSGIVRYTVVDVADNSTTVSSAPAMLFSIHVNTALSAHALPIMDAAVTVASLAASAAVGTNVTWSCGLPFATSLIVDPNDAATGSVTLVWAPL